MRLPVMGANWKLHKDAAETESFFESFRSLVKDFGYCEIVICPSFLAIPTAVSASEQTTIHIGAQNLYCETEGAFTGEVSGPMIKASGCSHVIVGHSERRRYFGETDASVLKKTVAALPACWLPFPAFLLFISHVGHNLSTNKQSAPPKGTLVLASSQRDLPVCLRFNFPPKVPET